MIDIPDSMFPVNSQGKKICPSCREILRECTCQGFDPTEPKTENYQPKVRLDKKGRKGKVVTIVSGLPADPEYLKKLSKELKSTTASGGTHAIHDGEGIIEIQGNHQARLKDLLQKKGFGY